MTDDGTTFPKPELILSARFNICFKNKVGSRYFEIQGANKVFFQRDSDIQLLWSWLENQGFLVQPVKAEDPNEPQNQDNPNASGDMANEEVTQHVVT